MMMRGADIVVECLKEQGVDTIFGYPGGAVLNIYDSIFKNKEFITHVLTSHEQGAAHGADGYARATGKVGVVIATSGPGATNLVTGIATAYMDSVPMVAITGNVPVSLLGKDSFQEVDIAGVTMPITKHNYIVKDVNDLASILREAFYLAKEGRPGPVLVDIPKDVTINEADFTPCEPKAVEVPFTVSDDDIETALDLIHKAERPFIYTGGGVIIADAAKELKEFVEKLQAPITSSLMGLGAFPGDHDLFTGMIGMHGTKSSNLGVMKCDLLIVIGARFSDRVVSNVKKFAKNAKVLHIDVDPAEINKNVISHHCLIGDVKKVLQVLNNHLEPTHKEEWVSYIKELKEKYPLTYKEGLKGPYVIEAIQRLAGDNAVITTEVGQHQMWAAGFYRYKKPRTFISSGGLGTMGYGLGAAIGAQMGCKDKQVVNIAGDGSFRMNFNELITAVKYNLPIIVVVINNHALGMVRQWQSMFYDKRYSFTTLQDDLNYVKLADAIGLKGYDARSREEFDDVFTKALDHDGPVLINCEIHPDDKVFPMVAPGASIDKLIMDEQ